MANPLEERIEEIVSSLVQTIEGTSTSMDLLSQGQQQFSDAVKIFGEELMRFRAWEALLHLFFARYYTEKMDPVGAATWDRDFLADQRRKFARDEAGARDIIKVYDAIFAYIKAGQEAKYSKANSEEEDAVM